MTAATVPAAAAAAAAPATAAAAAPATAASLSVANPIRQLGRLALPPRLLCGPGPVNAHPRVHAAMALPQLGHLDPDFLAVCEDVKALLRYAWQTTNFFTLPISGTGSAAWEAAVANLTKPGDRHLVFVNGYFGERHCDMASRYGATVIRATAPWGTAFEPADMCARIAAERPDLVWVCYAETSTGVLQPLDGVADACRALPNECLLLLDTVTALGGVPLALDAVRPDACYAAAQKCLACPPGTSPLTLGERAIRRMQRYFGGGAGGGGAEGGGGAAGGNAGSSAGTPAGGASAAGGLGASAAGGPGASSAPASGASAAPAGPARTWYFDLAFLAKYMIGDGKGVSARVYHHTAPIANMWALREALTILAEEGLENSWRRHAETAAFFAAQVKAELGLELLVQRPEWRLPSLTAVKIPPAVDGERLVTFCREQLNLEIGVGLGQLRGKIIRVGLMGYNSRKDVANTVVGALKLALQDQGFDLPLKSGKAVE